MLLGLLEELNSSTTETSENSATTAASQATPPPQPTAVLVGPTTAELESINELIHFDHVYFKPTQQQKPLVSVLKPVTKTSQSTRQKVITITTPHVQKRSVPVTKSATVPTEAPLSLNLGDVDLEQLSDTLEQVADFDQMFKQIVDGHEPLYQNIPATVNMVSTAADSAVNQDNNNTSSKKRKLSQELSNQTSAAKKAKHTDSINVNLNISMDTFSDSITTPDPLECGYPFEFDEGMKSSSFGESGYGSDAAPFSPSSDFSPSDLADTHSTWEESFTELFPSLL